MQEWPTIAHLLSISVDGPERRERSFTWLRMETEALGLTCHVRIPRGCVFAPSPQAGNCLFDLV